MVEGLPISSVSVNRFTQFKSIATSIEQKYIKRHNKKPDVSRRDEVRPSPTFMNISNTCLQLAKEMYSFRKMLEEKTQDYIFATTTYSTMTTEEREDTDETIKTCLIQFGSLITILGNKITNNDGLKNSTERVHLQRVHEGLQAYLKEATEYIALLKREYLKQVQSKNKTMADRIKDAQKNGHSFKYFLGLSEVSADPDLHISADLVDSLHALKEKHACLQYDDEELEENKNEKSDYDWVENDERTNGWDDEENEKDGWDDINEDLKELIQPQETNVMSREFEVRKRKIKGETSTKPYVDEMRETFENWKSAQGAEFVEVFQQQTELMKKEFVQTDQDDEIQKLEEQICEIQSLSSVFSEKIMDQERDIDLINDLALHTTENLVDGNEWIRKAITNSALRRVILLFCIIVLTFTLLFLDWYNP